MQWRLIDSGSADAAANMAIDEAILLAHQAGKVPPTLRFYGWRPAAVSLGYSQLAAGEIDLDACRDRGVGVVRRLTGGRAVLHDAELTYSIVVREGQAGIPPTITGAYHHFSQGLLAGLAHLGVEARLSIPRAAYGQRQPRSHASAACFDAPAHYEITAAGRKLVGSAQVRTGGAILQHGSLLLKFDPAALAAILRSPSPAELAAMLAARAVGLEELLGRAVGWPELTAAMAAGFGELLGDVLSDSLTAGEEEAAAKLAATKYSRDDWNLRR